jgi:hypothetical protein
LIRIVLKPDNQKAPVQAVSLDVVPLEVVQKIPFNTLNRDVTQKNS